jgi:chlorobactene glucosyltransferase
MQILLAILAVPLTIFTFVILWNFFKAPILQNRTHKLKKKPKLSVLIPVRNEERNIERCLRSVELQNYPNFEVIVLNDGSTDETTNILNKFEGIKIIEGKPLPFGWTGKNWACHQLSQYAEGDLLLFIDADVELAPNALSESAERMDRSKIDMLSAFPTQRIKSFGEWLTIPLMNWLLLTFLPLSLVHRSKNNSFVAANGQFLLIDKKKYLAFGGHSAVQNEIVEDMEIARIMKKNKYKVMTALGGSAVYCRMYNSFSEALMGFSKNYYKGFNTTPLNFFMMILFFEIIFLLPAILSIVNFSFIWLVLIIAFGRYVQALNSNQRPVLNVLLHPLQMIVMLIIGLNSIIKARSNKFEWKGREIVLKN